MPPPAGLSNFAHLGEHDAQLVRLGELAERFFAEDPNICLMKLRQWGELLAQQVATRAGLFASAAEPQVDLLRRLGERGLLPREVVQLFHEVRRAGNAATHKFTGDSRAALAVLQRCRQLGHWLVSLTSTESLAVALGGWLTAEAVREG